MEVALHVFFYWENTAFPDVYISDSETMGCGYASSEYRAQNMELKSDTRRLFLKKTCDT